jgi:hypothetical protein
MSAGVRLGREARTTALSSYESMRAVRSQREVRPESALQRVARRKPAAP